MRAPMKCSLYSSFNRGECSTALNDYEVENYKVGMYSTQPALCKIEDGRGIILRLNEESGVLTGFPCPIPKANEKNAATGD